MFSRWAWRVVHIGVLVVCACAATPEAFDPHNGAITASIPARRG